MGNKAAKLCTDHPHRLVNDLILLGLLPSGVLDFRWESYRVFGVRLEGARRPSAIIFPTHLYRQHMVSLFTTVIVSMSRWACQLVAFIRDRSMAMQVNQLGWMTHRQSSIVVVVTAKKHAP